MLLIVCKLLNLNKKSSVIAEPPFCSLLFRLTAFHLQQGFGQDASSHADGLADVEARVFHLHVGDGELAAQRHGETTGLRRLLDGEQQDLEERQKL